MLWCQSRPFLACGQSLPQRWASCSAVLAWLLAMFLQLCCDTDCCSQVASWQALQPRCQLQPLTAVHLLSSVSATVGNVGQSNYAAANATLDALAAEQASMGLPGTAGDNRRVLGCI